MLNSFNSMDFLYSQNTGILYFHEIKVLADCIKRHSKWRVNYGIKRGKY